MEYPEANIKFSFDESEVSRIILDFDQNYLGSIEDFVLEFSNSTPALADGEFLCGKARTFETREFFQTFAERKSGDFINGGDTFFILEHGLIVNMSQVNRDTADKIYKLVSRRQS